ncbi:FAD-dependent oxidoreductase [Gracilimonas sp.]|uniref:FAD-dependent oxidoreductase n=1 Tax=Gracilimonas sp. TaxID=1974203 RepID=UPI0032EFB313
MKRDKNVCIIGCGISGLSVAHLLQQHNWDVTIFTEKDPRTAKPDPTFSSLFPAASVIPRSVYSENVYSIFTKSQAYFETLYKNKFPGLKLHEHFELFTMAQSLPDYTHLMKGFTPLTNFKNSFHPKHPEHEVKDGWKFSCYFADWSLYYPSLMETVLKNGVALEIKSIQKEELKNLPYDIIINCSELGSIRLFDDPNDLIYRGHILQINDIPRLLNSEGNVVSYNFSPGADVYKTESGNSQDIYCYPRKDGLILGGSRQIGKLDDQENWIGEETVQPIMNINGIEIPAQIYNLHKSIIQETFGVDISEFKNRKVKIGYRYVRKKENGLRLETEELHDKLFIHNYGHGGAGVTLSWGCALEVLQLLEENIS